VVDVVLEAIYYYRGKDATSAKKARTKTRLYIQCTAALSGWTIFGISRFGRDGLEGILVPTALGIIACALFWGEFRIKELFSKFTGRKLFQ
jgi:hypothetical protein